jgi:hypothetical protein
VNWEYSFREYQEGELGRVLTNLGGASMIENRVSEAMPLLNQRVRSAAVVGGGSVPVALELASPGARMITTWVPRRPSDMARGGSCAHRLTGCCIHSLCRAVAHLEKADPSRSLRYLANAYSWLAQAHSRQAKGVAAPESERLMRRALSILQLIHRGKPHPNVLRMNVRPVLLSREETEACL